MRNPEQLSEATGERSSIAVMIVDDHPIAREGLRAMLGHSPEFHVAGEAASGEEALELFPRLNPAVILMDYKMPGIDGISATRQIHDAAPHIAVIIMTSYEDQSVVLDALQAGAIGFLAKDSSLALLFHTIHAVVHGGSLVKASLLHEVMRTYAHSASNVRSRQPQSPMLEQLTERERKIVELLAEGNTNRAIGDKLGFAEITVKKHVQTVIAKLYAADRTHAAITAMRLGLID
jgi:DNA-binding NarL/FixJ family response regulator